MRLLVILATISTSLAHGVFDIKSNNRIIGGSPVSINAFPYTVSLQYQDSHRCGGAIIAVRYIVTAAHCTHQTNVAEMKVRVGSHLHAAGGLIIPVESYHQHPEYNQVNFDYDITVIRLGEDLIFGAGVAPVDLPESNVTIEEGLPAIVTGWGITQPGNADLSPNLLAVDILTVSLEECRDAYKPSIITERMLCAGVPEGGKDSCNGDSGGPLVLDGQLIGLVSFGSCGRAGYPGGYANIAILKEYIDEIMAEG